MHLKVVVTEYVGEPNSCACIISGPRTCSLTVSVSTTATEPVAISRAKSLENHFTARKLQLPAAMHVWEGGLKVFAFSAGTEPLTQCLLMLHGSLLAHHAVFSDLLCALLCVLRHCAAAALCGHCSAHEAAAAPLGRGGAEAVEEAGQHPGRGASPAGQAAGLAAGAGG